MAFRLRRGTDSERLLITPLEGELIYVTDYQTEGVSPLYIGDGITLGGNPVDTTAFLDLGGQSIANLADVDIGNDSTVPVDGDVLAYHAASGDWRASAAAAGGATTLSALTDVDIAGVLNDDILVYNSVSAQFERETFRLFSLRDIDINSPIDGDFLSFNSVSGNYENQQLTLDALKDFDETGFKNKDSVIAYNEVTEKFEPRDYLNLDVYSDDSSILVDAATGQFFGIFNGTLNGTHVGNLQGNVEGGDIQANDGSTVLTSGTDGTDAVFIGSVNGPVFGELIGSVFGEDSSLLIDAANGTVNADLVTDRLVVPSGSNDFVIEKNEDNAALRLSAVYTTDESASTSTWGQILFELNDANGQTTTGIIGGQTAGIYIGSDPTGGFGDLGLFAQFKEGALKLGGFNPEEKLDVNGNAKVSGFVQFGSLTTTERNGLTAAAGMVIWNETTAQFEGFNGTNWINLVDGVIST